MLDVEVSTKHITHCDAIPTVDIEVIIWHIFAKWNSSTTIVPQVENPSFDTKPNEVSMSPKCKLIGLILPA